MKIGEIWKYSPSVHVSMEDAYFYNNKVKIQDMWMDEKNVEWVKVTLEDGSSPRAVDSIDIYEKSDFLSLYTKVYLTIG